MLLYVTLVVYALQIYQYPVILLPKEKLVDTNGAGDAFVGGELFHLHPFVFGSRPPCPRPCLSSCALSMFFVCPVMQQRADAPGVDCNLVAFHAAVPVQGF